MNESVAKWEKPTRMASKTTIFIHLRTWYHYTHIYFFFFCLKPIPLLCLQLDCFCFCFFFFSFLSFVQFNEPSIRIYLSIWPSCLNVNKKMLFTWNVLWRMTYMSSCEYVYAYGSFLCDKYKWFLLCFSLFYVYA